MAKLALSRLGYEDPINLMLGRFWFSLRFGSDFGGLVGLRVALALRFCFDGKP